MPTCCDAAGSAYCGDCDGESVLPLLRNDTEGQPNRERLYFEFMGQLDVRKGKWKYCMNAEGAEAMYDLEADRHEDRDLKAGRPQVFTELKARVAENPRGYTSFQPPPFYDQLKPFGGCKV